MTEDRVELLRTMTHHRIELQAALQLVTQALDRRALTHDVSKLYPDEFDGFARINRIAREHPYGSEEYRAALKSEKPTIQLHYDRQRHHPESPLHGGGNTMGLLDLIEMVADWYAAWRTYEQQRPEDQRVPWMLNVQKQRKRFLDSGKLSEKQWFVVEEMALLLLYEGK